jgi:phenylalanyl-tRNA synthetase alpha chain
VIQELDTIRQEVVACLGKASTEQEIAEIRVKSLGRKGNLTQLLKRLGTLPESERREIGRKANEVKEDLEAKIEEVLAAIREREKRLVLEREQIDVTLPGRTLPTGRKHPITQTLDRIVEIFSQLGFEVVEGPEVELDYYNFEALNIPKGHPAREMQSTFFISEDVVLRTHTSPVQVRTMEKDRHACHLSGRFTVVIRPYPHVSSSGRSSGGQRSPSWFERVDGFRSSDVWKAPGSAFVSFFPFGPVRK